jgi:nitroimidazol reductase NimA-like FMN-containing flavoprotein (pyridoxamine 5'-phosphate oxidase superfamily)
VLGDLSSIEIENVLHENVIGRIGCHAFGRTYVVPITYAYDGSAIYARSDEGMKLHMMRENPHVAFEVDCMDASGNWKSVMASGLFHELSLDEVRARFSWLVDEVGGRISGPPGETVHPKSGGNPSVVYRITLEEKTGRFERRL